MKLQVGKKYVDGNGDVINIVGAVNELFGWAYYNADTKRLEWFVTNSDYHEELKEHVEPRTKDEAIDDLLGIARYSSDKYTDLSGLICAWNGLTFREIEKEYMTITKQKHEENNNDNSKGEE